MFDVDNLIKTYNEAAFETDRNAVFAVVSNALAQGVTAEDIVFKVVIPAVEEMMSNITRDPDANLAQHFMTAQIAAEITEKMLARFKLPRRSSVAWSSARRPAIYIPWVNALSWVA